ncbi:MAG: type IX secretion system protein PorQ [Muribaculaceae bacterium]|nr:type IX secretion system protein PorQ [Muribaculaceae bacterium]
MTTCLRHFILLTACFVALFVAADDKPTTTAYKFLDVPTSSHVYGLGGHNLTIIDDDINLVEQNPALLGPEFDHQVGINYMRYIGDTNFAGLRYGQGVSEHGALAVGLQYFGYGDIQGASVDGVLTGTFTASDIAFNLTYSHDISERMRGGITLKYLYSKYEDYTAGAVAADLGINYYNPDNELSVSLVAKNLGGQVKKFNEFKDNLPWDVQVGVSKMLGNAPIRLHLTAYELSRWNSSYYKIEDINNPNSGLIKEDSFGSNLMRHLVLGADILPSNNLYLGIGYNYRTRTDMATYKRDFMSGLSVAGGLKVRAFGIGAAFARPHTGATTFMFNLTTSLGELLK